MNEITRMCDCELGHNGLGMAIRECDCWERSIEAGVCPVCGGDCASANPAVIECPMQDYKP